MRMRGRTPAQSSALGTAHSRRAAPQVANTTVQGVASFVFPLADELALGECAGDALAVLKTLSGALRNEHL